MNLEDLSLWLMGLHLSPSFSNEVVLDHEISVWHTNDVHSFKIHTATYNMSDLMSKASGEKVTTIEEVKMVCWWGTLLSLLNSLHIPFEAEMISLAWVIRKSSFREAPWSAPHPIAVSAGASGATQHQRSPIGSSQLSSASTCVLFGLPIVGGGRTMQWECL